MSPADVETDSLVSDERAVGTSISEATPLLPPLTDSVKKPWYSIERYSTTPAIYIIPVVLGARLANSVPTSTTVYVIQQVVCRLYYRTNDPSRIPPDGPLSDDLCVAPGVQQEFSTLISLLGVLNGVACMIGYSALNHFSSRYGRKPAILMLLIIALTSNIFLLVSQMNEDWELVMLVLWVLCDSFASAFLMLFLATTYVFDLIKTENRSSFLSTMYGCAILGSAVSFGFGGELTTRTHNILPVFRLAAILHIIVLTFTFFFLPESFTKEKREELRRRHASEDPQNSRKSLLQSLVSRVKMIFAPLKGLFFFFFFCILIIALCP